MTIVPALPLFLACAVAAAAERPADYAYGSRMALDGAAARYELTLPVAVYRGVAGADLRDLRVFNAAGEVVPHALRPRATQARELARVRGEPEQRSVDAPREWLFAAQSRTGVARGEYGFDTQGHFPVDRVRLHLPEANTVVQIELFVRAGTDRPWRAAARGVAFPMRKGETEVISPEIVVQPAMTERFWLLRVDQRGGGIGANAPRLEVGWVPHRLVFVARGPTPVQIACGKHDAAPAAYAIETLVPGYREHAGAAIPAEKSGSGPGIAVKPAHALQETEPGGAARRREAVDWKRWSLWGALALEILVLGFMAWRLLRQLDRAGAPPRDRTC